MYIRLHEIVTLRLSLACLQCGYLPSSITPLLYALPDRKPIFSYAILSCLYTRHHASPLCIQSCHSIDASSKTPSTTQCKMQCVQRGDFVMLCHPIADVSELELVLEVKLVLQVTLHCCVCSWFTLDLDRWAMHLKVRPDRGS